MPKMVVLRKLETLWPQRSELTGRKADNGSISVLEDVSHPCVGGTWYTVILGEQNYLECLLKYIYRAKFPSIPQYWARAERVRRQNSPK